MPAVARRLVQARQREALEVVREAGDGVEEVRDGVDGPLEELAVGGADHVGGADGQIAALDVAEKAQGVAALEESGHGKGDLAETLPRMYRALRYAVDLDEREASLQ